MVNETKTHIANIGRMIETMESEIRSHMNELYLIKTREIVNSIRSPTPLAPKQSAGHINVLNAAVLLHGKSKPVEAGED